MSIIQVLNTVCFQIFDTLTSPSVLCNLEHGLATLKSPIAANVTVRYCVGIDTCGRTGQLTVQNEIYFRSGLR